MQQPGYPTLLIRSGHYQEVTAYSQLMETILGKQWKYGIRFGPLMVLIFPRHLLLSFLPLFFLEEEILPTRCHPKYSTKN